MTAPQSNLETVRQWYSRTTERYEGGGLEAALELIPEVFDPDVEFSPWLTRLTAFGSHDEAMRAAEEVQHA